VNRGNEFRLPDATLAGSSVRVPSLAEEDRREAEDAEKWLVCSTLDSKLLNDYDGQIGLGSELAASFSQIREHRKPTEFTKQ
jgi:hypothetical protein